MSSYRRVPQQDGVGGTNVGLSTTSGIDNLEATATRSRGERLQDKLVALAWMILAIFVAKWTHFFGTLWSSDKPNRTLLHIATAGLGIVTALILYLIVYLPKVKGLVDSSAWSVYCPRVIPTMTAVSVVSYLIFLRATWPVWGFLAPLIFGTQCMGLLMSLHFVPTMWLC